MLHSVNPSTTACDCNATRTIQQSNNVVIQNTKECLGIQNLDGIATIAVFACRSQVREPTLRPNRKTCGWYVAHHTGACFPPGFCVTTWRYAGERLDTFKSEFPRLSPDLIKRCVILVGENDNDCELARASLETATGIPAQEFEFNPNFFMDVERNMIKEVQESRGCFSCGKDGKENALSKCSKCKVAVYCSKECQATDWKVIVE